MQERPLSERIESFLSEGPWAVVGASTDRAKFGNKVLRCYVQAGKQPVYAVNPRVREVEGRTAWPRLAEIPERPRAVSIITPPAVTEGVVEEMVALGIGCVWMQPEAESGAAVRRAQEAGMVVIAGGPCLLVVLGYRE